MAGEHLQMKSRIYSLFALSVSLLFAAGSAECGQVSVSKSNREYRIKAAFLYNFIKFTDWPKQNAAESNDTFTIGIIGDDPFGNAFEPLKNKRVKDKKVIIKRFEDFKKLKKDADKADSAAGRRLTSLKNCQLLFICSSEKDNIGQITAALETKPVLTVGETAGLLEAGGIIRFVTEDKKVGFEVDLNSARKAKLKIRSGLLRIAKKVVVKKNGNNNKN